MIKYGREVFAYRLESDIGDRAAVSFLEPAWVAEHGLAVESVLGFVEPAKRVAQLAPPDFRENPAFLRLLSRVIFEEVGNDPTLHMEADVQGEGSVYLLDGRTPNPGGRVPPEDIIGAVKVEAGRVVPGSFRHNPRHRLLTAHGCFRLSLLMDAALDARLRSLTKHVWWPLDSQQL